MAEEFSEQFLTQLRRYLSDRHSSLAKCGEAVDLAPNSFLHRMRQAYDAGFLVLKSYEDRDLRVALEDYWRDHGTRMRAFVAAGTPDDLSFARWVAEKFLQLLRDFLRKDDRKEMNIGIVSGSSTGLVIEQLVQGRLWEELMSMVTVKHKIIKVIALNVTPVDGWELEGNANIAVLRLAVLLREKLPTCTITPYGLSSTLIVSEQDLKRVDYSPSNLKVVEITDPERLGSEETSRLDLVITGVGSPENSVFEGVLKQESITAPKDMVGDVAFSPVNEDGQEVTMTRKIIAGKKGIAKQERCLIYSAIRLKTLKQLAETGAKVMLVARNRRRGQSVNKTAAILAAIRGGYVNYVLTDEATAKSLTPRE